MISQRFLLACLFSVANSGFGIGQIWGRISTDCSISQFECKTQKKCISNLEVCNKVADCSDGSDEMSCDYYYGKKGTCNPLTSTDTIYITCYYNEHEVSCINDVKPGTVAVMDCKLYHKSLTSTSVHYNYCQYNGRWLHGIPNCDYIDCQLHKDDTDESSTENDSDTPNYPWLAVIYKKQGKDLKFAAMGTLISEYAVITEVGGPYGPNDSIYKPLDVSKILVAFGQKYFDPKERRNKNVEYFDVKFVHLFSEYLPTHSRVCIIELKKQVSFNYNLMPACLDTNRAFAITNESVYGMAIGWDSISNSLKEIALPYIERLECYRYMKSADPAASSRYIAEQEEYCAGFRNGTTIDAKMTNFGTGFMYKFESRYFLYGVAKNIIKLSGTQNELFVFNDIRNDFILDFINVTANNIRKKYERTCRSIAPTFSIKQECSYGGKDIPCTDKMPIGSLSKISCAAGYRPVSETEKFINYCNKDGEWLYKIPECTHDCGIIEPAGVQNYESEKQVNSPWLVSMYYWRQTRFVFTCSGTLVTPTAAITVSHCADPDFSGKINSTAFSLAVGKKTIFFLDGRDVNAQYIDVEQIYVEIFSELAIFELRTLAIISKNVKPVCLNYESALHIEESHFGNVVSWDYYFNKPDSIELKNYTLKYLGNTNCDTIGQRRKRLTTFGAFTDKEFCGYYTNEQTTSKDGSEIVERGCGATFMFGNRHYLIGIVEFSVPQKIRKSPGSSDFVDRSVYRFVDLRNAITFINETLTNITKKRSRPLNRCVVPTTLGTKYSRTPCTTYETCKGISTIEFIEQFTLIHINCMPGYILAEDGYSFTTCYKGRWQPDRIACVKLCPPLTSRTTWSQCWYRKKEVRCDQNVRPGTVAVTDCKTGYTSKNQEIFYENQCLESGEWRNTQPICKHICGTIEIPRPLIQNGVIANRMQNPWVAAIYFKYDAKKIEHICGGTLIAPHIVISAAHCVYDQTTKQLLSGDNFVLGFGKEHRSYKHSEDKHAIYSEVAHVHTQSIYDGRTINFLYDISILELAEPVAFSKNILPACLDIEREFTLTHESMGIVAGWGFDDKKFVGKPTELLHEARLPYISLKECLHFLRNNEKEKLTKDKFCAFYMNDTAPRVRSGDSGGGLIFEFSNRYYLYGLVSTEINQTISTFTDIRIPQHMDFIISTVQKVTRKYNNLPDIIKNLPNQNTECTPKDEL